MSRSEDKGYLNQLEPSSHDFKIATYCIETVETAEGILPIPPLSTNSIACFISILW